MEMKAKGMMILSGTHVEEQFDDVMEVNNNVNKQSFIGAVWLMIS